MDQPIVRVRPYRIHLDSISKDWRLETGSDLYSIITLFDFRTKRHIVDSIAPYGGTALDEDSPEYAKILALFNESQKTHPFGTT